MSKRNLMWLAAIVLVGVVTTVAAGFTWGLISAGVILVVSEVVERARRRRRRQAGATIPSARDAIVTRRRPR
jgi:Flp pilus assembly protein TadB